VLLHVFGHVDANHGALVVEEKFGKGAGEFGFADAGWAQENKRPDRPLGIAQSGARTADGVGDAFERGVLSDDAQPQPVFHIDQLLDLASSIFDTGMPVHLETMLATSSSSTSSFNMRCPVLPSICAVILFNSSSVCRINP